MKHMFWKGTWLEPGTGGIGYKLCGGSSHGYTYKNNGYMM